MTSTNLTTRLEQQLDAAWTALQTLPELDDEAEAEKALAAACDTIDAAVWRIKETIAFETLGDLRLHAKALEAWHAGYYGGDVFDSLPRLLKALESLPERLWNERIGPA